MADNQEEKIKFLIKKRGFGIDEAIKKLAISKQTFYNNIRKEPISRGFKLKMRALLGIDVDESLINTDQNVGVDAENKRLREELDEVRKALDRAKDEIIELLKKYNK